MGPDKKVDLTIWRDGGSKTVQVTLGKLPADKEAKADATSHDDDKAQLASLGLTLVPSSVVPGGSKDGVTVAEVDPDGIAAQKGLNVGDVILEAGGKTVSRPSEVTAAFNNAKKDGNRALLLRVKSGDSVHYVALTTKANG